MNRWRRAAPWAALAAAALLYWAARGVYYVGYFNDDACYLIGAKSLLLTGRYASLQRPGQPPMIQYVPGYPLLVALVLKLSGESVAAVQLATAALLLAGLWLVKGLFEELPSGVRLGAFLLAAASPILVRSSGAIMAEGFYLFWLALCLRACSRLWGFDRPGLWAGLGLAAGFAALIRPSGLALPLALGGALLLERRRRSAAAALAAGFLPLAAFYARNRLLTGFGSSYEGELALPFSAGGAAALLRLGVSNVAFYLRSLPARGFFGWIPFSGVPWHEWLTAAGFWTLAGLGLRRLPWTGWRKIAWLHAGLYVLTLLPWYHQSERYLIPLLPFAALALLLGAESLPGTERQKLGALWGVAALSLAVNAVGVGNTLRTTFTTRNSINTPPLRTYGWVAANIDRQEVVAAQAAARLYLYTGRKSIAFPAFADPADLALWMSDVRMRWVVLLPSDDLMPDVSGATASAAQGSLIERLSRSPLFRLAYLDPVERSAVFQPVLSGIPGR